MPAAQVIDLSPIPNRSGTMFGEGFADEFSGQYKRRNNNQWFQDAIGDEQDPIKQADLLDKSPHPLDPEFVRDKRKKLFEKADAMMVQDQYKRKVQADKRKQRLEDEELQRQNYERDDEKVRRDRSLEFLEDQMKLPRGTLSGADPKVIEPYAREDLRLRNKGQTETTKKQETDAAKQALLNTYPEETKDIPVESLDALNVGQIEDFIKNKQKSAPKEPKTPEQLGKEAFYKKQGTKAADAVAEAQKKLSEIKGNRQTINELRELNNKLKGPGGYLKILSGSKDASEFNALGHSLVKVPLSIFNPTGPVGVRKLEQLKEIYAITASERYGTIEGKLRAAEWMNQLSEQAAKAQVKLYEKYNGFPPQEELDRFNDDFERTVIDPALEQSFQEGAEQMVGGFYSAKDGKPLKPMPKSKAQDLMEKGLITHELK